MIPYMHLDIDDEDSLTERFQKNEIRKPIDFAVIRLPRISNFTDFSPFEHYANVSLRYVDRVSELHEPDVIFLPGTKSTIADLLWLRQSGLEAAILRSAAAGTPVFGICGGYQMLGKKISDPDRSEAAQISSCEGMGLLDHETVFREEKIQTQTDGTLQNVGGIFSGLNGLQFHGYEIHMGQTPGAHAAVTNSGNVYGTYIHGLFDDPGISGTIVRAVCGKKGIRFDESESFDLNHFREHQYDVLADTVRKNLNMEFLYGILEK